jgi:hypothetical protein
LLFSSDIDDRRGGDTEEDKKNITPNRHQQQCRKLPNDSPAAEEQQAKGRENDSDSSARLLFWSPRKLGNRAPFLSHILIRQRSFDSSREDGGDGRRRTGRSGRCRPNQTKLEAYLQISRSKPGGYVKICRALCVNIRIAIHSRDPS